LKNLREN